MKVRTVQTRFWDDEFIAETDLFTQHLYLYLMTCPYINLCGMFQLSPRKMMLEAKLSEKQLNEAKANLQAVKKVIFCNGWVYVVNAEKNNPYVLSPKNEKPRARELAQVPQTVRDYFSTVTTTKPDTVSLPYAYGSDTTIADTANNQKPTTKNQKPKTQRARAKNQPEAGEETSPKAANGSSAAIYYELVEYVRELQDLGPWANKPQQFQAAKHILSAGYTLDEAKAAAARMHADPFWQRTTFGLQKLAQHIARYSRPQPPPAVIYRDISHIEEDPS